MRRPRHRVADLIHRAWNRAPVWASLHHESAAAERFAAFGAGSLICFPWATIFGEAGIRIGTGTMIGPFCSLSAGMVPGQELLHDHVLEIGDGCLIGRGSSLVAHYSVQIGNGVYTGPNVYITDQNHAWDDPSRPLGHQAAPEQPVRVGDGSWLGTGVVVLPGVTIGRQVAVGAGSVVTKDLPDHAVAVGTPARVVGETAR